MAREAGFETMITKGKIYGFDRDGDYTEELKSFEALVRADEREACLANVKKVFATFDVLLESAEKKMLKSVTSIFIESIKEEIELRVKS
jgi:hypothetical protein